MRISQLSTAKRSEDFVESFKLLSILSCSKLGPQDRALNVDSDIYPLARDAYGIKDLPTSLFLPTAVTFHEPLAAGTGTDSSTVTSDRVLTETEKSITPVSFPCADERSAGRKGSVVEVPACPSTESISKLLKAVKKDFQCVDEKGLGSSFAKCLHISEGSECKKNRRNKDACDRARDSRGMSADAVRKIGREYLRKHVRIWHDMSEVEDDDDDSANTRRCPTPRHSFEPSENTIKEEDQKPEFVDGSTQTTDEFELEISSKFVDCTTQTLDESDNAELLDDDSCCKISKCLPLSKCMPKSKAAADEIARLTSQNSLDVLSHDITKFSLSF